MRGERKVYECKVCSRKFDEKEVKRNKDGRCPNCNVKLAASNLVVSKKEKTGTNIGFINLIGNIINIPEKIVLEIKFGENFLKSIIVLLILSVLAYSIVHTVQNNNLAPNILKIRPEKLNTLISCNMACDESKKSFNTVFYGIFCKFIIIGRKYLNMFKFFCGKLLINRIIRYRNYSYKGLCYAH